MLSYPQDYCSSFKYDLWCGVSLREEKILGMALGGKPANPTTRAGNSLDGFLSASLVFLRKNERMSNSLKKMSDSHICSFLVSDLSESLMVAHFW